MAKRVLAAIPSDEQVTYMARAVLALDEPQTTILAVLDEMIRIAYEEKLDVEFVNRDGKVYSPDMAYRLRWERGLLL